MPTPVVIKHQKFPVLIADHVAHLLGNTVKVMPVVTQKNTVGNTITVATTNATGQNHLIQTFSYSYDGIIHLDSYCSDI